MNGDSGGVRGDYHAESGEVFVIGGDGIIIFRGFFVEEDLRTVIEEGITELPPVSATPDLAGPGHRFGGAYPNPFNPTTRLVFSIAPDVPAQPARLEIVDLRGRVVKVLVSEIVSQGRDYEAVWNGRDASGLPVGSGVYMARLRVGQWQATRALTLVK